MQRDSVEPLIYIKADNAIAQPITAPVPVGQWLRTCCRGNPASAPVIALALQGGHAWHGRALTAFFMITVVAFFMVFAAMVTVSVMAVSVMAVSVVIPSMMPASVMLMFMLVF